MQTQSYYLEGLSQANVVLTRSNSAVMAQFSYMTVAMNAMQDQLKTLSSDPTNPTRTKKSIAVGVAGEIKPMGVKPARPIKRAIRKRPTTRSDWAEAKRGSNDG